MSQDDEDGRPSRRTVLKTATATAGGLALVGSGAADHTGDTDGPVEEEFDESGDADDPYQGKGVTCGYTNPAFGKGFVFPEHHEACAGDHPETKRLKDAVRYSLDHLYPDVPTLIAHGFIPYFDILSVGGFSHWLKPDHIRGDHMVDPGRPETILVNNNNYCAQGIMFIPNHEVAGQEPPVYVEGSPEDYNHQFIYQKRSDEHDHDIGNVIDSGSAAYYNSEVQGYYDDYERTVFDTSISGEGTVCAPWHRHTDGLARFAWWYHRQINQGKAIESGEMLLWCVVPAMFHVWPGADPGSIHTYEHGSPSSDRREDTTLCHGSYENGPYTPDDGSALTLSDLPPSVQERAMPADLNRELEILGDFEDSELYQMTVSEIQTLVR